MKISRRFAGGLLALATLGVVAVAQPASALDPIQTSPTPTTEAPEQQRARENIETEIRAAFGKAKARANMQKCRDFFGRAVDAFPDMDALAVLSNVMVSYDLETETDDFADIDPDTGDITLYKSFFDTSENSALEQDRKRFSPPLTAEEWQAMVVLHEILHLFGKDHDESDESVRAYDDALAKECLGSSKPKPPDPPPPPGGLVDRSFHDGAVGGPQYTVPQYVFVDPLPEGRTDVRIVVPDDPEIVPDPEPLPDGTDPDDPCALDPLGCRWGGGYDPYAMELMY